MLLVFDDVEKAAAGDTARATPRIADWIFIVIYIIIGEMNIQANLLSRIEWMMSIHKHNTGSLRCKFIIIIKLKRNLRCWHPSKRYQDDVGSQSADSR